MLSMLMEILACPVDHSELKLEVVEQKEEDIIAGSLTCMLCGEIYPIQDSVPNFLPTGFRI